MADGDEKAEDEVAFNECLAATQRGAISMMRKLQLFISAAILTLVACSHSQPQAMAPHQPTLADIQRQYTEAEARLNDMEARDYAANPHLQPTEQKFDLLYSQYQLSMQTIDPQVEILLDEQKKKRGNDSVRDDYELMEAQWKLVRSAEQAADPEKAELLRVTDLADPDFITNMGNRLKSERPELKDVDLTNPDKFWQAYRDSWASNLQRLTNSATEAGQKLTQADIALPDIALLWARKKAAMEMDMDLFKSYLDVVTPDDLQAARDALDDLQDEMDAMTPVPPILPPQLSSTKPTTIPATQAIAP
jgi:hypothetical protein